MRHYIIHFWQQLPNHVLIDLDSLKSLDLNLYSTLEDIYLRLDSSSDQLRHLCAIATLNPLWLKKALENYSNESVRGLKIEESLKWKYRVKSQFQMIQMTKVLSISSTIFISKLIFVCFKALDLTQINSSVNTLKQLDYRELVLINESVLNSFLTLLEDISKKTPTLQNIIESFDSMIKKWNKVYRRELLLGFSHLHSYALKKLTQTQSQTFGENFIWISIH